MKTTAPIQRIVNGFIIPNGAKVFVSKLGRECYLSGLDFSIVVPIGIIRYLDTGEFKRVEYKIIEKYL